MPILDGIEATKRIRTYIKESKLSEVPIIALTANIELVMARKDKGLFDDTIEKPIND